MRRYILDSNGRVQRCDDTIICARWMEAQPRHIGRDEIDGWFISTVFLGLDHSFSNEPCRPVLWETMVFKPPETAGGRGDNVYEARYSSRLLARRGHEAMVRAVRDVVEGRALHLPDLP